jgi:hypothetical protein
MKTTILSMLVAQARFDVVWIAADFGHPGHPQTRGLGLFVFDRHPSLRQIVGS